MKTIIDNMLTEVKFLLEKDSNDVFAYFPKDMWNYDKRRTCYAHIGQHSGCHPDYAKRCKEATIEQYQDLKAELESIGYKLQVLNKK